MAKVSKARQFIGVLMSRNTAAKHRALESMQYFDDGLVKVKIGGAVKGKIVTKPSRRSAVMAVTRHYDHALLRALRAKGWTKYRGWMGASVRKLFKKYRGKTLKKAG